MVNLIVSVMSLSMFLVSVRNVRSLNLEVQNVFAKFQLYVLIILQVSFANVSFCSEFITQEPTKWSC